MEQKILEEIMKERIEENKNLFSERELDFINNNMDIVKKIYCIGYYNSREIYGKKLQ